MDLKDIVDFFITTILKPVGVLVISFGIVFFLWNIFRSIAERDNAKSMQMLKERTKWGVIALAVMVSIWGLVSILTNTFLGRGAFIPQLNTNPHEQSSFGF